MRIEKIFTMIFNSKHVCMSVDLNKMYSINTCISINEGTFEFKDTLQDK